MLKKHPNRNADQICSGCTLYRGKVGDAAGDCAVFGNNQVASVGWCGAWTKKGDQLSHDGIAGPLLRDDERTSQ